MKKLALLLSLAVLAACGVGGSKTQSTTNTSGNSYAQNGPKASFSLQIVEPKTTAMGLPAATVTPENWRRVVITNPSLNSGTSIFQQHLDYNKTAAPALNFNLPVANGYLVEVLDYTKVKTAFGSYTAAIPWVPMNYHSGPKFGQFSGYGTLYVHHDSSATIATPYTMVSYGSTNLNLTETGNAGSVTMIPVGAAPVTAISGNKTGANVPSSIYRYGYNNLSTATYAVTANFTGVSPVFNQSGWGLKLSTDSAAAVDQAGASYVTGSSTARLYGPYAMESDVVTQYAKGYFYARDTLLLKDKYEPYNLFVKEGSVINGLVKINSATGSIIITP
jgi:hypothetical protein